MLRSGQSSSSCRLVRVPTTPFEKHIRFFGVSGPSGSILKHLHGVASASARSTTIPIVLGHWFWGQRYSRFYPNRALGVHVSPRSAAEITANPITDAAATTQSTSPAPGTSMLHFSGGGGGGWVTFSVRVGNEARQNWSPPKVKATEGASVTWFRAAQSCVTSSCTGVPPVKLRLTKWCDWSAQSRPHSTQSGLGSVPTSRIPGSPEGSVSTVTDKTSPGATESPLLSGSPFRCTDRFSMSGAAMRKKVRGPVEPRNSVPLSGDQRACLSVDEIGNLLLRLLGLKCHSYCYG